MFVQRPDNSSPFITILKINMQQSSLTYVNMNILLLNVYRIELNNPSLYVLLLLYTLEHSKNYT
jgi:hypothetical protein